MGEMVIVSYRPKPGREGDLLALAREHVPMLRRLGLATERQTLAMRSKDGVILEIFEWEDGAAVAAHENPEVLTMWEKYPDVCDYVTLSDLPETKELFAMFEPIDL